MAIDSQTRTVGAVTRLSFYQGASPASWSRFVRQLAGEGIDLEKDTTDSLLSLLSQSEVAPPSLISYALESLQGSTPLVRPAYLARALLSSSSSSLPLSTTETIFSLVNSVQTRDQCTSPYIASSPEETAQGLINLIDNVLNRFAQSPQLSALETVQWSISFLNHHSRPLTRKELKESDLVASCKTKIERFLDSIALSAGDRQPEDLKALVTPLSATLARLTSNGNKRRPISKLSNSVEGPELNLFVAALYSTSPRTVRSDFSSHLSAILKYRQQQADFLSMSKQEATIETFSQLFIAMDGAQKHGGTTKSEVVSRSICGVKLPRFVKRVVEGDEELTSAVAEATQKLGKKKLETGTDIDSDDQSSHIRDLVAGLCREGLISQEQALSIDGSIPMSQSQISSVSSFDLQSRLTSQDAEEIKQTLALLSTEPSLQAELSRSICEVVSSHAQSTDLDALALFCDALIQEPSTLEIVFVHEEPKNLLSPIRETLDSLDTAQDNFGESNLIERYGNLVIIVEMVVHRFELLEDLSHHLGSSRSFLSSWIPTSSAAYNLSVLDEEGRTAVAGFIGALFGDGISDDLMHATNPRTLLRIAPTILKQSLVACQNGVVDLDSLKDALSYFLQELLSFTLPGVLRWLIGEIERTPPSPAQNAMFDILQVILFADSVPKTVLELVSSDLASLISSNSALSSASPPPFDVNRTKRLVLGFLKRSPRLLPTESTSSWFDQLKHCLTLLAKGASPNAFLDAVLIRQATTRLLLQHSPDKIAHAILSNLLTLIPLSPYPQPRTLSVQEDHDFASRIQIERTGAAIFAESTSLLHSLVNQVLPRLLSTPSFSLPAKEPIERSKVEMLADIIGGAFTLSLSGTDSKETKGAVAQLDRLVLDLKSLVSKVATNDHDVDTDGAVILAKVFVERLTSYESLTLASETFSKLSVPHS